MNPTDLEQNFFARDDIRELLKRRVIDLKEGYRQNVAILGNKYVGKSALIKSFIMDLDDSRIVPIYLDLESKDFSYFVRKFIGSLLYQYAKLKELSVSDDTNILLEITKKYIPHTVQVIKKIQSEFQNKKFNAVFCGLLNLTEIFTNESGMYCLLIFDEFQVMEDYGLPEVYETLGKKIMTQKKCLYVMTSSFPVLAQKILQERLSLLFGNFEMVSLEPFDLNTSQQFIESNLKNYKIGSTLKSFLTDFTGGYPLYLNLICRELVNLSAIHNQSEIYLPIVSQAVENTLFDRWGVISRHFELIINDLCAGKGNQHNPHILITIANGKQKAEDILLSLDMKRNPLMQRLNRLLDNGIVVKNGTLFYFKDKMFKYWIKYIYQKRVCDVELSPDKQRRQFKEEFHNCIEHFKLTARKDFSSRIMELFYCFDNELLQINGRRYKLPNFKEMTPIKFRNESGMFIDVIKAMTNEAEWLIALKKENLAENDVNVFISEAKRMGRKPERCILISLTDLDDHTRLKALQERFWIWNEEELNTLLTLFDKPFIVR